MEELDIATIKKRSIHGILALTSRSFLNYAVLIIASAVLSLYLSPEAFGIYTVVSAVLVFFSYFSDIGLAAALIQKKEPITEEELRSTFTIQQILVLCIVIIAFVFSPWIGNFYGLNNEGIILFLALIFSFFLSSLKTIPSVILERKLDFKKLVVPQIVENFVYNILLIILAMQGFGLMSFTYAVLARSIVGVIVLYYIAPWKMGISFSKGSLHKLLKFGIPFQTNSLLALVKDSLFILYLGKILPFSQVGYIGFAQKWTNYPLQAVMDNIIRITFPSYARIAHDKALLGKAIEKTLFAISALIFPTLTGMVLLAPYLFEFIPRLSRWEPALFSLTFFALQAAMSSISTPLTNALNSIGKVKITLQLMVFWTTATWILSPLLISLYGFNGVSISFTIISFSVVIVIYLMRKYAYFRIMQPIGFPLFATVIMGTFLYFIGPQFIINIPSFIATMVLGGILYIAILYIIGKDEIKDDIRLIRENIKK